MHIGTWMRTNHLCLGNMAVSSILSATLNLLTATPFLTTMLSEASLLHMMSPWTSEALGMVGEVGGGYPARTIREMHGRWAERSYQSDMPHA